MIDIHSHILYGVDDGSESREMSLEMLRMSEASGVTDIFATPHVNRKGLVPDWTDLQAKAAELQRAADEAGIQITIHLGAEVELNGATMDLLKECKDDRAYCLGGSHYVLIELTDRTRPNIAENMLYTLQLRGYWLSSRTSSASRSFSRSQTACWAGLRRAFSASATRAASPATSARR